MQIDLPKVNFGFQMHLQHDWPCIRHENRNDRGRRDVQPLSHVLHTLTEGITSNCNSENCQGPSFNSTFLG